MDDQERESKLASLARRKSMGEKAYDEMYEAHSFSQANGCYSDAKESFYDAIGLADELGLTADAESLKKRLEHIKQVFRSQFVQ